MAVLEAITLIGSGGLVIAAAIQLARWGLREYEEHYGGRS